MDMKFILGGLSLAFLMFSASSCGLAGNSKKIKDTAQVFAKEDKPKDLTKYSQATFAAGCFWHEETLFESIKGVADGVSGYAGGNKDNPTYEDVETGETGHAETVNIYYDSTKISYPQLVKIYFEAMEDPTQVNGQGPDHGTQYRSIIFYRNDKEKQAAEEMIIAINKSGRYSKPVAAEVIPFTTFWRAEDYHQHYIDHNYDNPYVESVSIPDIKRFQEKHPEMIKPGHSFAGK